LTSSNPGALRDLQGVQQARISHFPPYASTLGDDAIDLARLAGIELDPWQQVELRHAMGESADWKCPKCTHRAAEYEQCAKHPGVDLIHPWAAFEVVLVVPRQNGKSELLVARQLAGLFLLEEPLQIFSAHLFDTAMEIFRRLVHVVENCDDLRAEVVHRGRRMVGIKYGNGDQGIELTGDRRIRFKARTAGGGRGFSADCLYLDEAMILPEAFLGPTLPTLSARSNPQVWMAGSAPDAEDPSHDGVVLTKRRNRALRADDPSLAYFEHSAEGESPDEIDESVLDNPAQRALANPALNRRITSSHVENERRAMSARQFAIERLGIGAWSNLDEDAGRVISREAWTIVGSDRDSRIASDRTFALDVDPGQAWATIAAAGEREDGSYHIGVVRHERGTGWILAAVKDLRERFPDSRLVIDPRADLGALITEMEDAGIEPVKMTAQDYKEACGGFLQVVTDGRLRYMPPQPELDAAVAGASTRPLLDAWKWDRASGALITPLVACTNALWGARNAESEYATLLVASDHAPTSEDPEIGPAYHRIGVGDPVVLTQEETTTCFACRVGGCTIHGG
jgi:hypothetical protein